MSLHPSLLPLFVACIHGTATGWTSTTNTTRASTASSGGGSVGGFCDGRTVLAAHEVTNSTALNALLADWSSRNCTGLIYLNPSSSSSSLQLTRRYRFVGTTSNLTIMASPSRTSRPIKLLPPASDGHFLITSGASIVLKDIDFVSSTGGALRVQGGSKADISRCTFRNNRNLKFTTTAMTNTQFPSLAVINSILRCRSCSFRDHVWTMDSNQTESRGNSLWVKSGSSVYFCNSSFTNNTVVFKGGYTVNGGAVLVENAKVAVFEKCTWSKNRIQVLQTVPYGVRGGAILVDNTQYTKFTSCAFLSNSIVASVNQTEVGLGGLGVGRYDYLSIQRCR